MADETKDTVKVTLSGEGQISVKIRGQAIPELEAKH